MPNVGSMHTPGPWRYDPDIFAGKRESSNSLVFMCGCAENHDEAHANGYLIAAAPYMLETLESIAETLDKMAPCPEEILDQLLAQAQSAIRNAKAVNYVP